MKRHWEQLLIFFFCIHLCSLGHAEDKTNPEARWTSDRSHRLLVRVDARRPAARRADESVAQIPIDFTRWLPAAQVDLSSLQVIRFDASGQPTDDCPYVYAATKGDRPLRFYDADIPWDYPEREGYAHGNDGQATPERIKKGAGRFFDALGQGRAGRVAWAHRQEGDADSWYAIYFNVMEPGEALKAPPAGFLGDGIHRCLRNAGNFAPVIHGRVALADMNQDGLFDLVLGNATGTLLWYANTGKKGQPAFGPARMLFSEDDQPLDVGWSSAPAAADWDGDGDLDLIVGAEKECFIFYENIGDPHRLRFRHRGLLKSEGKPLRIPKAPCKEDPDQEIYPFDYYPVPEIVDWDGDGDLDLLAGGYITGLVFFYENVSSQGTLPELHYRGPLQADGSDLDVTWCASPTAADFDGDGDLDLISGAMQMTEGGGDLSDRERALWYFENTGSRSQPTLEGRPFPSRGTFPFGALATPRARDINGDGNLDLVTSVDGRLFLILNGGTADAPLFNADVYEVHPAWGNATVGGDQYLDVNEDGWPDKFTGSHIVLNDGRGSPGLFRGKSIPLVPAGKRIHHPSPSGDSWDYRTLADVDNDGRLDILSGDHSGHVWLHRNIGTVENPEVDVEGEPLRLTDNTRLKVGQPPEDATPFDILQGARTVPAAGDFNRDGRTDLVVADTFGTVRVYLHAGTSPIRFSAPHTLERIHPIRLIVQVTDWDGDGWNDLMLAYASGQIYVCHNAESPDRVAFDAPQSINIPECYGSPWIRVVDWNRDGDDDLILNQYGYSRFVERSFIQHGYAEGNIVDFQRESSLKQEGR